MNLSDHFTLDEFILSQEAVRKGIDNTPTTEIIDNLRLVAQALETIRATLGGPALVVSSGYRSPALNEAVGGVSRPGRVSRHVFGLAVDFTAPRFRAGSVPELANHVAYTVPTLVPGFKFYQVIYEYGRWVHLGLARPGEHPAGELLTTMVPGHYTVGLPSVPEIPF